jgi:hypothetical protein
MRYRWEPPFPLGLRLSGPDGGAALPAGNGTQTTMPRQCLETRCGCYTNG